MVTQFVNVINDSFRIRLKNTAVERRLHCIPIYKKRIQQWKDVFIVCQFTQREYSSGKTCSLCTNLNKENTAVERRVHCVPI